MFAVDAHLLSPLTIKLPLLSTSTTVTVMEPVKTLVDDLASPCLRCCRWRRQKHLHHEVFPITPGNKGRLTVGVPAL